MTEHYMSELVCSGCGHTGHVTWEGQDEARRPITMSEFLKQEAGDPPRFTCLKCGATQHLT